MHKQVNNKERKPQGMDFMAHLILETQDKTKSKLKQHSFHQESPFLSSRVHQKLQTWKRMERGQYGG